MGAIKGPSGAACDTWVAVQDGQMRFFRSVLLWKLATDSPAGTPADGGADAIGAEVSKAALRGAEARARGEVDDAADDDETLEVDDAALARTYTLFQVPCHLLHACIPGTGPTMCRNHACVALLVAAARVSMF